MSLRILHIAPYSPDAWAYGGIPRVVSGMTRGLAARGHGVTLCATDAGDDRSRATRGVRDVDGVIWRLFANVSNRAAYHLQAFAPVGLRDYLAAHAHRFDIAHLHACHNIPGVFAARALGRAGVPWVLSPNGTAPIFERRQTLKRLFALLTGDAAIAGAARVLAVSEAEEIQLRRLGIAEERICHVPNPVEATAATASADVVRGRFREQLLIGNAPLVAFVGKITPRKHVDTLVAAFAKLDSRNAQLVIAGNDLGGLQAALDRAAALGIRPRVHTPGLLSGTTRLELMADADVVVYPSQDEVFGLVACEALAQGTPVVVGSDSGCAEVVGAVGGGVAVPPGDPDALAAAIANVLRANVFWKRRAVRAGRQVEALFGESAVASQLEQIYERVLGAATARLSA